MPCQHDFFSQKVADVCPSTASPFSQYAVVPLSLSLAELFASIGFAFSCSIAVIFTKDCVHSNVASSQLILLMRCRGIKWEELDIWPQLQAARVLLLQQGIEQGQPAAVQLMLQIDPSLVRQCSRYVAHASGPTLLFVQHAIHDDHKLSYTTLCFPCLSNTQQLLQRQATVYVDVCAGLHYVQL